MALQGSPHKPMAPLPKRKASASSIRDASSIKSPITSTFPSRTSPAPPSPAHSPSASASPLPTGTFEPPAPVIEQNAQFDPPGMHERAFFPGTISDPSHPQYQYPHHHQLHQPASASNNPMTLDEYDDYDNDNYESPPENEEEEEEEQEPEGRSWPSNMRHTTYAGHPPANPDFATNHFSQSADRLAFLAHMFAQIDQREELQRIIGPGFSVKSGSQFLGAPSRNAADEGIAITAQCGVKLGRALRREGSWMPDTAAGRAEQKRRDEEKKEKLKLDPPGYPPGGLTEWNEDTEKEDGGVLKVKKKKNKKKKKGKKVAGGDEAEADAGSEGNVEAEELDRAEQGGVPAIKDDAELGDKGAEAEAVEAAPTVKHEAKGSISGVGDKPSSTDFESTVEHHTSELTPATAAPEPEPEQPEPEVNSEEERAKRKEDKLQRDRERKAAKKERANKKKEALGIVKKPWVPPPPPVEEVKVEEPEPKPQKKVKVKKAKAEPVEKKEVEDGDQAAPVVRVDEPMAEKTVEAEPTVMEPAVEQTTVEQPGGAKPGSEQPTSQPVMEQPAVEERRVGRPSDENWRQRAPVPAVQKKLDEEQVQAQAVPADTINQPIAHSQEAARASTPQLKKSRRRREKNTTQSPISSKTPLRPPQAERPHARHVSAKAQLSWTQLHPETAVSIQVSPPDRPVSTPPINFLAQPASPSPETLTSTPARLVSAVPPGSHSPPSQPSADHVEAKEMFFGHAEQRQPAPEPELEGQSEGKSEAETDVPDHLDEKTETDYAAVPDLTSSSTQSTNNTSVRTPESSPLRPLVKLPVIEQEQEEGPGEEEDVPCIQVESPSARASHIAEKAAEEDAHGGITETGERVTSPTLTETSADVIEEEGKGMLGVSYTQDRATTPAFNGVEVAAQDEKNSGNKAEGPGSPAFNENTHNRHFPLARTWKLYFSDTDKVRSAARAAALGQLAVDSGGRSTAQSYSSSLIKLIESGDVADLFGKWKALRRQVAIMTGREIEGPGTAPAADKLGLGLHTMSDDHNFQFFVKGVKPMWEDRMCKMGGKISFTGTCEQLDSFFFEAVLTLISNILPSACPSPGNSIQVVGVAFGRKPKPAAARVDIWFGGLAKVPADYAMSVQSFLVQHINVEGVSALRGGYKEFYAAVGAAGSGVGAGGGMSRKASGVVGNGPGSGHGRTGSGISAAGSPMLGQGALPAFGAFASFGAFGGARNASSTPGVHVPVVPQGRPHNQQNTHHQLGQQLQRPQQPEAELSAPKQEAQKTPFEQHHTQHVANPEAQVAEQPPEQVQHPAVQQQYRILTRPPVEARPAHEAPAPAPVDSDPLRITVPVSMLSPVAQAVLHPPAPAQASAPVPVPAMLPPLPASDSVPLVDVLSVPTNPLLSSVLPTTPLITPMMTPHGTPPVGLPPQPDMYPMQDPPYSQQPQYGYEYGYGYGPLPGFQAMQLPPPEMIHPLPLPPHSHLHMQMQAQSQMMQMQIQQQQQQQYHYQHQQQQPQHHLPPGLYVQPDGRVMQYAHPETQPQPQPQSHSQIQAQDQLQPQLQSHHQAGAGQLYQARPPRPPRPPQHHQQQQHLKQRHPLAAPPLADADVHARGHSEGARPNGHVHGKGNEGGNVNGSGRDTRGKRGARGGQVPMGVGMAIGRKGHGRGEGGGRMASNQSNAV